MRKFFIVSLVILSTTFVANSQAAKSIYFELGGPGIASFNFDTRFSPKEGGLGGRIGIGGFSIEGDGAVFVPIGLNYLLGNDNKNYFEIGAAVTPVFISESNGEDNFTETFGTLQFGYRMQPVNGGFTFRAFICPVFASFGFLPYYGGVSFGYKFGNKKAN